VGDSVSETPANRLKRLRLRSWQRGIREMDLILGRFADASLAQLDPALIESFDVLLSENDHDLYRWVAGSEEIPTQYEAIMKRIRAHHKMV
jgi:antitoxin CptB